MWLLAESTELAKLMLSAKNVETLADNLRKVPPQRTPPELDKLQEATRGVRKLPLTRNSLEFHNSMTATLFC